MNCPKCGKKLIVIDSRPAVNNTTRRRLECIGCGKRVSTLETIISNGQHSTNAKCEKCLAGIFSRLARTSVTSGYTSALTGCTYETREYAVTDTIKELERIYYDESSESRQVAGKSDQETF